MGVISPPYYTTDMDTDTVITLPCDVLEFARMSAEEAKRELAASLYTQGRLSVGKAREFAEMSLWAFRQLLALRGIPAHYDVPDQPGHDVAVAAPLREVPCGVAPAVLPHPRHHVLQGEDVGDAAREFQMLQVAILICVS